ncbi:hypothetical protein [Mesorhizobium sp. M0058]|uniref:hypothetical protein n=1 Tax=Mesorhizobium sp. M0058 TaxID=2956865 RepID=UPI0033370988
MATAMCVLREQWRKRYHLLGFGIGMAGGYTTIGGPVSISAYYAVIGTVSNHAARLCEEPGHASGRPAKRPSLGCLLLGFCYGVLNDHMQAQSCHIQNWL